MKVLTATKEKQGKRKNDFSHTKEGELVKFGMVCDGETTDGGCGCKRSTVGFGTLKATTTIKVEERNITEKEFIQQYIESDKKAGWYEYRKDGDKEIIEDAKYLLELADSFDVGTILEKRGNKIQTRP
jgi:hypothetical protein